MIIVQDPTDVLKLLVMMNEYILWNAVCSNFFKSANIKFKHFKISYGLKCIEISLLIAMYEIS